MNGLVWWVLAVVFAVVGVYAIFEDVSPLWTLMAGLGVGASASAALRSGRDRE